MRRPLLFMAAAFAAAIFICHYAGSIAAIGLAAPLALLAAGRSECKGHEDEYEKGCDKGYREKPVDRKYAGEAGGNNKRGFVWLVLICYLLSVVNYGLADSREHVLMKYADHDITLAGEVAERHERRSSGGEEYIQMEIRAGTILERENGPQADPNRRISLDSAEKVLVNVYEEIDCAGLPGQQVIAYGKLKIPEGRRNPGCFDYRLYLKSLGIRTMMTAESIQLAEEAHWLPQAEDLDSSPSKEMSKCSLLTNANTLRKTMLAAAYTAKIQFLNKLQETSGAETAGMMDAILFGDKSRLDEDILESFQRNGTAHILAVSGLHIGILYAFLMRLWDLLGKVTGGRVCSRRGWSFLIIIGTFFWFYMIMASFAPSVVRAVIMILLHVIAQITNRRYDLHCAAFAVFLVVLVRNPFMLFNTGFQMSFLAVLTMGLILPYIHHFYSGMLAAGIAIQLGLGPFIAYTFNYVSIASVLVNIPVIILAGIMLPMGVCGLFISSAGRFCSLLLMHGPDQGALAACCLPNSPSAAENIVYSGLDGFCHMLKSINQWTEIEGVTNFTVTSPGRFILGLYYTGLLLLASEEGRMVLLDAVRRGRDAFRTYAIRVLAISMAAAMAFAWTASDGFKKTDMVFVDVGQGDCLHLRIDGRAQLIGKYNAYNVLIDGGGTDHFDIGKKVLRPYLLKNGVRRIDLAIVTHLHTDHYDGIRSLCRQGMVKRLCVYEGYQPQEEAILRECGLDASNLVYAAAGDVLTLGDARFEFLAPPKRSVAEYEKVLEQEDDENKKSLLVRAVYDSVSVMMTGDLGEEGEAAVLADAGGNVPETGSSRYGPALRSGGRSSLQCDILKIGHHGSKYSTTEAFLEAVNPAMAVIQVGAHNMYGHPTPEVLQRLEARDIPVWRNDLQGAVGIEPRGGRIARIRSMLADDEDMKEIMCVE